VARKSKAEEPKFLKEAIAEIGGDADRTAKPGKHRHIEAKATSKSARKAPPADAAATNGAIEPPETSAGTKVDVTTPRRGRGKESKRAKVHESRKPVKRSRKKRDQQTETELVGMLARGVDATPPAPVNVREEHDPPTPGLSSAPAAPTSRRGRKGRAQARSDAKVPAGRRDPRVPATGTELVRVFRGKEHRVIVRDEGFEYQGDLHRSLSSIACSITGASWNGFSFFGLLR